MNGPAFTWTDRAVREALELRLDADDPGVEYTGVTTDSRGASEGELFVALEGENFDGHDFVADALAAGASGAVVSRRAAGADEARLYVVDDTLVALGRLARYRRRALPATVVGITGSSGKTTTKDMLAAALASRHRVHATRANLNNRVGVPLTLLAAPEDAEILVVEMGSNEPGEIGILAGIAEPDLAVVTTVGESHLEKLGSVEGVLREKLDLVRSLEDDAWAVVGDELPALPRTARKIHPRVRVAGWSPEADPDLRPTDVEVDHWGYHRFRWHDLTVRLGVPGRHAVQNALIVLAVCDVLGVSLQAAARALADVEARPLRGEVRRVGRLTLLLDCYNANPQSVAASLDLLEEHGREVRRVVVLGTMLELGDRSEALHAATLDDALARPLALVVATGTFARVAGDRPARGGESRPDLLAVEDPEKAYEALRPRLEDDEVVLLKASRGVALEALVPLFERDFGDAAGKRGDTPRRRPGQQQVEV